MTVIVELMAVFTVISDKGHLHRIVCKHEKKRVLGILGHSSNLQSERNDVCTCPSILIKPLKYFSPDLTDKDVILTQLIKQLT